MKIKFCILLLILNIGFIVGQTKDEIENSFAFETKEHQLNHNGFRNYYISDGFLVADWAFHEKKTYVTKIEIKSIKKIVRYIDENCIQFTLHGKNCTYNYYRKNKLKEYGKSSMLIILIDPKDPTLIDKMSTDLLHLVELYGGKAILEYLPKHI